MARYEYLALTHEITSNKVEYERVKDTLDKIPFEWRHTWRVWGPTATTEPDDTIEGDFSAHAFMNRMGAQGWRLITYVPGDVALFRGDYFYSQVSQAVSETWRFMRTVEG